MLPADLEQQLNDFYYHDLGGTNIYTLKYIQLDPLVLAQTIVPQGIIEINTLILNATALHYSALLKVLKHEVVHYYLWQHHCEFKDGTDTFESLLAKYSLATSTLSDIKNEPSEEMWLCYRPQYLYKCSACGINFYQSYTQWDMIKSPCHHAPITYTSQQKPINIVVYK